MRSNPRSRPWTPLCWALGLTLLLGSASTLLSAQQRRRPSGSGQRVVLCHIPPGHPERRRTIVVPPSAVPAHLAHGDTLGPCEESFRIVSCSLGCTETVPGQLGCALFDIALNQEIRVAFNQPVDLSSVNTNSFQVIDFQTGTTPPGQFHVDPADPRVLIYRPSLTFDSAGNPIFGLIPGHAYQLRLSGSLLDPFPPYITSITGQSNETRLLCTLVASDVVIDPVPGAPSVQTTVVVVGHYDPQTGEPDQFDSDVPANGAQAVYREGDITFLFNDLMNPGSIANPVTGQSSTIAVLVDPDGDLGDPSDQVPIPGRFLLSLDPITNTTTARFDPADSLPASGNGARIVLGFSTAIRDLAGNPLVNPGPIVFQTEAQ